MTTTTAPVEGIDVKDAMHKGVEGAKRAIEKIRHGLEEAAVKRDELVHRAEKEPVKAMKYTFGAGLLLGTFAGIVTGVILARRRQ